MSDLSEFPRWFVSWVEDLTRKDLYEIIWNHMKDEDKEELAARNQEEEEGDEEEPDDWFDRKYPNATCHTCVKKLNGQTVVYCGGGGGACETWYCSDCHERKDSSLEHLDCPICLDHLRQEMADLMENTILISVNHKNDVNESVAAVSSFETTEK